MGFGTRIGIECTHHLCFSHGAGVPGVLAVASGSLDTAFGRVFCFFVFFFFARMTAGRPPKFPRADTSSLVLQVVQIALSGGEQNTTDA